MMRADPARGPGSCWWQRPAFQAALLFLTAVPLLWPAIPPLADYPGHIGSYYLSLVLPHSAFLRGFYDFHWAVIGNLGVDLAIVPLAHLFGLEPAAKLVAIAVPVLTAGAMLAIARAAHGRLPATAALALPFIYNFYFLFGFMNFALGAGLALFGFALWLRWDVARRPAARWAVFALVAVLVWLAHAIAWVMLCAMCAGPALRRAIRAHGAPLAQTALALTALGVPLALMRLAPAAGPTALSGWLSVATLKLYALIVLRDRWRLLDLASIGLVYFFLLAVLSGRLRLRLNRDLAWAAGALLAAFLLLPISINGSWWVNARILPFAIALLLLAVDPSRLAVRSQAWLAAAALAFAALRLGANTASLFRYGESYTVHLAALDRLPPRSIVIALAPESCAWPTRDWRMARLEHLSALAIVRRESFSNAEWNVPGLQLLHLKPRVPGFAGDESQKVLLPGCAYAPAGTLAGRLAMLPRGAFTHLWLVNVPRPLWPAYPWLHLVWSGQDGDGHPGALFRADPR